ncbi:hypothetical protein Hanom_Chr16g01466331 [Helianthus anomalus]
MTSSQDHTLAPTIMQRRCGTNNTYKVNCFIGGYTCCTVVVLEIPQVYNLKLSAHQLSY